MPADPNQAAALTVKLVTEGEDGLRGADAVSRYLPSIGSESEKKGGKG